jgi:NAD(P)-dependent dehydrogenase (short-subunit alcohol dehydrogenase family)
VATELTGRGLRARGLGLDVSDPASSDAAIRQVIDEQGQLDVLCLHAGGHGGRNRAEPAVATASSITDEVLRSRFGSVMSVSDEALADAVALNITGNVALLRPALRHMVDRRSGVVMVTISVAGLRGGAGSFAYMMVKHAMVGLVRHIAWVFGLTLIGCSNVHAVRTCENAGAARAKRLQLRGQLVPPRRVRRGRGVAHTVPEPQPCFEGLCSLRCDALRDAHGRPLTYGKT